MNKHSSIEKPLLRTLVPVNSLTDDHLDTLLREASMEVVCPGQKIVSIGENDSRLVYLLSGQVLISNRDGDNRLLSADNPECRFPLSNFKPRIETITAANDCLVIRLDSTSLDRMLAWDQASTYLMLDINASRDLDEDADWLMTLLKSNLFHKVPPVNIRSIIKQFSPTYLAAGETIIRQGELADCCYFIKEGVVAVYKAIDQRFPAEPVTELGPGKCFGEDALVNNTPRNATIVMKTNGVLMRLDKLDFFRLLKTPAVDKLTFPQVDSTFAEPPIWIDVRTQDEFEAGHYPGAINMPLNLLKLKAKMISPNQACITYCNSGRRSEVAAYFLTEEGYKAKALAGGMAACTHEQQEIFTVTDEQQLTGTD